MPKYDAYKDSGVEWLGEIPDGWEVKKIKYLFYIGRGRVISQQELDEDGSYPVYSSQTKNDGVLGYIKTYDYDCNQITWTTDGANAGTIFLRKGKHNCTNVCGTLQPKKGSLSLEFLSYSLDVSSSFYKRPDTNGAKIMNNEMAEIFVPFPPTHEQTLIAKFLDQKIAKIDKAIEIKHKQIELLKEQKQIVINNAVTKGLDPNTPMKDSGIEWIGEIPEGWEVKKAKYILTEVNQRSETGSEELLSLSKYKGIIPKSSLEERAGLASTLVGYKKVFANTLVINKMQAVNGLLAVSNIDGITSPDYSIYSTNSSQYNIHYYGHLLSRDIYLSEFKKVVTGVMEGFIRLYTDDLYNIKMIVPSALEQQQIVAYIEEKTSKIDKAIELQNNQIDKLKEYKASLINSVVTGKVRVTDEMVK